MGWSHTHMWQIKLRRDILAVKLTPEGQRTLNPHQAPQSRVPEPGREVLITSGYKNLEEIVAE